MTVIPEMTANFRGGYTPPWVDDERVASMTMCVPVRACVRCDRALNMTDFA